MRHGAVTFTDCCSMAITCLVRAVNSEHEDAKEVFIEEALEHIRLSIKIKGNA